MPRLLLEDAAESLAATNAVGTSAGGNHRLADHGPDLERLLESGNGVARGLEDGLTRELTEWQTFASPREARAHLRQIYDEDRWLGQPCFPVLVVEKDTMVPVCEPMARNWQMPFASSRGYGSLKLQHDTASLIRRRYAMIHRHAMRLRRQQEETGLFIVVYFISDHDPSGLDLQRAWEQALKSFGAHFDIIRIGLSRAHK
jgi:hypothetical protein